MNYDVRMIKIDNRLIKLFFAIGNVLKLPFINKRVLKKIVHNQIVSTKKINNIVGELPYKTKGGILHHFNDL